MNIESNMTYGRKDVKPMSAVSVIKMAGNPYFYKYKFWDIPRVMNINPMLNFWAGF